MSFYSYREVVSSFPNLALLLALGETDGLSDLSGNGHHGTAVGGITVGGYSPGPLAYGDDGATNFDGSDDGVLVSSLTYNIGQNYTFMGWARRGATGNHTIFSSPNENSATLQLVNNGEIQFRRQGSGGSGIARWAGSAPSAGSWFHWALTIDQAGEIVELFLNGISLGTQSRPPAPSDPGAILFGDRANSGTPYLGQMGSLTVHHSLLTSEQIAFAHQVGSEFVPKPEPVPSPPEPLAKPFIRPSQFSIVIEKPNGQSYRWGADEELPTNVPFDLSFTTSMPGGFESCSLTLARRIDLEWSDIDIYDTITIYGPGAEIAWQGRIASLPRGHGDDYSIRVEAIGWSAHLRDDPSFREIYVDRDLSAWDEPSIYAKSIFFAFNQQVEGGSVVDGHDAIPEIELTATEPWGTTAFPYRRMTYWAGGIPIGSIYYEWIRRTSNLPTSGTNWDWRVQASDDVDALVGAEDTGNLIAAGPGSGTFTPGSPKRAAHLILGAAVAAASNDNREWKLAYRNVAVYGAHGLTKRGTAPQGFYASDIIRHAVGKGAPLLKVSEESVRQTGFVIPHCVFKDSTTVEEVIQEVNKYHLYEWGVFADANGRPEFFFRQPNAERLCWEARLSKGDQIELEGDEADDIVNGVYVTFNSSDGRTHTVGPPGSGAEHEDQDLKDDDPNNPITAHGIPRRWAMLEISGITSLAAAKQIGYVFLAEKKKPQRRGSLTIVQDVIHPETGRRPVWQIKAGDWIRISDHPTDVPRQILQTAYTEGSDSITLTLDNTKMAIDAILARADIALTGIIS